MTHAPTPSSAGSRSPVLPIGVVAYWKGYDRKLYLKAARLADDLGYDSFWVPEAWGYNSFPLLTEMACETRRIRLGTGIVNVFSRSAGLLAMSAATLQEISDGRFILGIGTSAPRVIEGFHGRAYEKPLTQTRDVLRVVSGLLAGKSLDRVGAELSHYRPFELAVKPLGVPVPIYVAALKQKAIESVGELADGWMPAFWPYRQLGSGLSHLHAGAARAGRDPQALDVALFTAAIPVQGERALDVAREIIGFYVGGMGTFYRDLLSDLGFAEDCRRIAALYEKRETRKQATAAVPREMVEAMTAVGTPLECARTLRQMGEHGVTHPIIGLPPASAGWAAISAYLRAMAPRRFPSAFQLVATAASMALGRFDR